MIGATTTVTIRTLGPSTVDSEGRTTQAPTDAVVEASVDELTTRDVEVAAQVGQRHDIAVRVDGATAVTDRAQVVVTTPTRLAGTYDVDTIRTTRRHLRLLCSRSTIRDT